MNTDKRCPLYGKAHDSDAPLASRDSDKLITEMRQEGMAMRYNTWNMGSSAPAGGKKMEMVDSVAGVPKGPAVDRAALLKGMSKEEKLKLLKKLEKMERKKEKKQKKKKRNDTSDDDSDDDKKVKVKKEPESGRREIKREPESRREERREIKREPESRRSERRSRSRERRRRRSYSRDEERRNRRDRSRDRR